MPKNGTRARNALDIPPYGHGMDQCSAGQRHTDPNRFALGVLRVILGVTIQHEIVYLEVVDQFPIYGRKNIFFIPGLPHADQLYAGGLGTFRARTDVLAPGIGGPTCGESATFCFIRSRGVEEAVVISICVPDGVQSVCGSGAPGLLWRASLARLVGSGLLTRPGVAFPQRFLQLAL